MNERVTTSKNTESTNHSVYKEQYFEFYERFCGTRYADPLQNKQTTCSAINVIIRLKYARK